MLHEIVNQGVYEIYRNVPKEDRFISKNEVVRVFMKNLENYFGRRLLKKPKHKNIRLRYENYGNVYRLCISARVYFDGHKKFKDYNPFFM